MPAPGRSSWEPTRAPFHSYWAQDKGGPSKGGFLNNMLFSHTDLYLCSVINGMRM